MNQMERNEALRDPLARAIDGLPLRPIHFFIIALLCVGHLFEVFEVVMSGIFGVVFGPQLKAGSVSPFQVGLLMGAVGLGAAAGSPLMGRMADIRGRRLTLMLALVIVSFFSFVGALTRNIDQLIFTRALACLGIGSYLPLATTYLTELIPSRARGRAIAANMVLGGFGGSLGALMSAWLNAVRPFGLEGWRCTMIFGSLGCGLIALLMSWAPESPRWLLAKGRRGEAQEVYRKLAGLPPRQALPDLALYAELSLPEEQLEAVAGDHRWTPERKWLLAFLALLSALYPWALTSFSMLGGAIFTQRGYTVEQALVLHSVTVFGVTVGSVLNMFIIDRVPRIPLLIGSAVIGGVATMIFGLSTAAMLAIGAGLTITASLGIYQQVLMLYSAERFPPLLRGKVPGICYGVNRAVVLVLPLVMMPLLMKAGEGAVLSVIVAVMSVSVVLLLLHQRGAVSPQTT